MNKEQFLNSTKCPVCKVTYDELFNSQVLNKKICERCKRFLWINKTKKNLNLSGKEDLE